MSLTFLIAINFLNRTHFQHEVKYSNCGARGEHVSLALCQNANRIVSNANGGSGHYILVNQVGYVSSTYFDGTDLDIIARKCPSHYNTILLAF